MLNSSYDFLSFTMLTMMIMKKIPCLLKQEYFINTSLYNLDYFIKNTEMGVI